MHQLFVASSISHSYYIRIEVNSDRNLNENNYKKLNKIQICSKEKLAIGPRHKQGKNENNFTLNKGIRAKAEKLLR